MSRSVPQRASLVGECPAILTPADPVAKAASELHCDAVRLGVSDRLVRKLPAARVLLPEGDSRDWTEIDVWADGIAQELA